MRILDTWRFSAIILYKNPIFSLNYSYTTSSINFRSAEITKSVLKIMKDIKRK